MNAIIIILGCVVIALIVWVCSLEIRKMNKNDKDYEPFDGNYNI